MKDNFLYFTLNQSDDIVLLLDGNKIDFVNKRFEDVFQFPRVKLVGIEKSFPFFENDAEERFFKTVNNLSR